VILFRFFIFPIMGPMIHPFVCMSCLFSFVVVFARFIGMYVDKIIMQIISVNILIFMVLPLFMNIYRYKNIVHKSTFLYIFFILAICLSPLPWIWGLVSDLFITPVIITDLGLVISSILLLKDFSRTNAKKIKNLSLIWFITGLLAFILGTL